MKKIKFLNRVTKAEYDELVERIAALEIRLAKAKKGKKTSSSSDSKTKAKAKAKKVKAVVSKGAKSAPVKKATVVRAKAKPTAKTTTKVTAKKVVRKATPVKKVTPKKPITPVKKVVAKRPASKPKAPVAKPKAAVAKPDDLTKIKGVGKVMVGKLKANGISTFKDLAAVRKAELTALNEKLMPKFPGRMERENWVGQAKALAKK